MDQIVSRLELVVGKLTGGAGDDGEGVPLSVAEYDRFYADNVQPFVDTCNSLDLIKNLGAATEKSFKHARVVIEMATQCKKPAEGDYSFLTPIVDVISAAQEVNNRSPGFNFEKAYAEAIQCHNWLLSPGPKGTVMAQVEAADFYLTKVLTVAKDKEDPEKSSSRNFVKQLKALLTALGDYCNEFHKSGLMWKVTGIPVKDFTAGAKPAASEQKDAGFEGRLEDLCAALEAYAAKQGGGDDGDEPACVVAYNELYSTSIQAFLDASKNVKEAEKISVAAEKAFKHLAYVVKATTQCSKPGDDFMEFLKPIVEVITEFSDPDRKGAGFNHEKSFSEAVQALNFICMDGGPKGYIMGQIDAGAMYTNKILMSAKDKEDPEKTNQRAFVNSMKAMLTGLADFCHEHYKMGIIWKVKDAISWKELK